MSIDNYTLTPHRPGAMSSLSSGAGATEVSNSICDSRNLRLGSEKYLTDFIRTLKTSEEQTQRVVPVHGRESLGQKNSKTKSTTGRPQAERLKAI